MNADTLDCGGDIAQNMYHLYHLLLLIGPEVLRRVFLRHWHEKGGVPWLDTAENANHYWEREQSLYIKKRSHMSTRTLLKEGISSK